MLSVEAAMGSDPMPRAGASAPVARAESDAGRQLVVRNWMTHDAMWFRHCVEAFGIEATNRVNRSAVRSMAAIEARRVAKLLGVDSPGDAASVRRFVEGAWTLIGGDFMRFEFSWPDEERLRVDVRRCFAHDGVQQLGVLAQYECGIFERIESWFDALGLAWRVEPTVRGCMMYEQGRCYREYSFDFPRMQAG